MILCQKDKKLNLHYLEDLQLYKLNNNTDNRKEDIEDKSIQELKLTLKIFE